MKNKLMIFIACFLCLTAALPVFGEEIYFVNDVFENAATREYAEKTVIFRAGNCEYIANNIREAISRANTKITPYKKNNTVYVPLCAALSALNAEYEETEKGIKTAEREFNEGDALADNVIERRYGTAFAAAEDVAAFVGTELYTDGDVAVFGENPSDVSAAQMKEIKENLEYNWGHVYTGPLGYVNGIVFHPKNPSLRYACTDVGGIYKWDNDYERWMPLMESLPFDDYQNVWAMTLDPNDENVIYVVSGYSSDMTTKNRLLKSTDGGESWTRLDFSPCGGSNDTHKRLANGCIAVDPNNSNVLYYGTTTEGLFISEDGGKTWTHSEKIPNGPAKFSGIVTVLVDGSSEVVDGRSSVVYAGMDGVGVYRSTDGGKDFTLMEGSPLIPFKMKIFNNTLYVSADQMSLGSGYNGGLFKYSGGTWHDIFPTAKSGWKTIGGFFVDEKNPNVIIAQGMPYRDHNTYRTTDGGKTWIKIPTNTDGCDLVQDPFNPNGFYMPHGAGIKYVGDLYADEYVLEDADKWIEELCTNEVISIPDGGADGSKVMTLVYDHALMINERLDVRAWEAMPKMQTGTGADFCEEDPNIILETALLTFPNDDASPSAMQLSTDGGKTFTRLDWPTGGQLCDAAVGATKQENGWPIMMVASRRERNGLYRSKDGGKTWEHMKEVPGTLSSSWHAAWQFLVSDRVDGQTFYYNEWGVVWVTRDGGDTWTQCSRLTTGGNGRVPKTVPGMTGIVFNTTNNSDFHVSYDYGNSWSVVKTVENCKAYGFGKGKDGGEYPAVYLYGRVDGQDGVFISDDFCKTWRKISDKSKKFLNEIITVDGDRNVYGRVYLGTQGGGVFYGQAIDVDDHAPIMTLANVSATEEYSADYAVYTEEYKIKGTVDEYSAISINNDVIYPNGDMEFEYTANLQPGLNTFTVSATDESGNRCEPVVLKIRRDDGFLWVECAEKETTVNTDEYTVSGRTSGAATVYVNGTAVETDEHNEFECTVGLAAETNNIKVYAASPNGITSNTENIIVHSDKSAPVIEVEEVPSQTAHGMYLLNGRINEPGEVRVNGQGVSLRADNSFSAAVMLSEGKNVIRVQARDYAGNATMPHRYIISKTKSIDTSAFESKRIHDTFVYDGNVDDWELDHTMEKLTIGVANNWAEFATAWDEEYLYVAVKVMDDAIGGTSPYDHENDCIEIYIDGDYDRKGKYNEHDKQLKFSMAGDEPNNDMYIRQLTEDGYSMEIKIPWTEFGTTAQAGKVFGFEIDCCDNDKFGTSRDGVISFNGTATSYMDTTVFATVTLTE